MSGRVVARSRPLDGLRGVALLGVAAFHLSPLDGGDREGLLGGAWLSVDLFFALSGYLITSLLLVELDTAHRIDLRAFWRRRVRRLQPAALVAVAGIVATARWWSAAGTGRIVREEALAALTGLANWQALWAHRPYAAGASPSGFEHFWTLAVEEQFYLAWPLLFAAVGVVVGRRRRLTRAVVLGLSLAGVAVSWTLLAVMPFQRAYLGTDTRMGAILLGAVVAVLLPVDHVAESARARRWAERATVAGLTVCAAFWIGAGWPPDLPLGVAIPVHGLATVAILVGLVLAPHSLAGRILGCSPLVGLGLVSYGAYLWHWPVFVLLTPDRLGAGWAVTTVARLAAVAVLTLLSWFLVERPIRLNRLLPRTRLAWPAVFVAVVAVAVLASRTVGPTPAWARADGRLVAHEARRGTPPDALAASPHRPERVLVVGDSIATSLVSGPTGTLQLAAGHLLDRLADRGIAAAAATITGCPVLEVVFMAEPGVNRHCIGVLRQRVPEAMDRFRPDLVVWYSRQEAYPLVLDDGRTSDSERLRRERYAERLRWFAARGAKVLLVSPGPNGDGHELESPMHRPESMVALDATLVAVARENPETVVGVVHMEELLCNGAARGCPDRAPGGGHFRGDGVHFFGPGEGPASEWLAERIAALDLDAPADLVTRP